jgi:hypothetical protein
MTTRWTVIEGGVVATRWTAYAPSSHRPPVLRDGLVECVGHGPGTAVDPTTAGPTGSTPRGCLVDAGAVKTPSTTLQWVTRGLAVDDGTVRWLTTLYPGVDRPREDIAGRGRRGGLGWLARPGLHDDDGTPLVFPRGWRFLGATSTPRTVSGCGSWPPGLHGLGCVARARLPPDDLVVDLGHDPGPLSLAAVEAHLDRGLAPDPLGLAPCSPFSVSQTCSWPSSALWPARVGVRLTQHLAETRDEDDTCCGSFFGLLSHGSSTCRSWVARRRRWFAHGIPSVNDEIDSSRRAAPAWRTVSVERAARSRHCRTRDSSADGGRRPRVARREARPATRRARWVEGGPDRRCARPGPRAARRR